MEVIRKLSDIELVKNLESGTKMNESVKAVYRDHFDSLSWFVINNSGSRADAEDIFQEVVLNFIELLKKGKFRGESSVRTFLFALNRNLWLNELKRRGRMEQRELKYERAQDRTEADVGEQIVDRESREKLIKVVAELGETCKKVLLMFYYENLSMREMLDKLDYENEQTVRNKKYKCLKQLEQMIDKNPALKQTLKNLFA
jgi:RNA polymerase sigma factor (sigma-70 family)